MKVVLINSLINELTNHVDAILLQQQKYTTNSHCTVRFYIYNLSSVTKCPAKYFVLLDAPWIDIMHYSAPWENLLIGQ